MTPLFIMHAGYEPREVELVLSREKRGWKFYGRDKNGYLIPARRSANRDLSEGMIFPNRRRAAEFANTYDLPAYATWNGRTRAYDGKGAKFRAYPRDSVGATLLASYHAVSA